MAMNPEGTRQEAMLRTLNLNDVIPQLWPETTARSDGGGWRQWRWPDGLKVNVAPDGVGFTAWDHREGGQRANSRGPAKGRYAGMLVQAVEGRSFPAAITRLKQAGLLDEGRGATRSPSAPTAPAPRRNGGDRKAQGEGANTPFVWRYDYSRPWRPVRDYLVGVRGLPESVVHAAWDQGQIQMGYGQVNGHYILFPLRDWSRPDSTPHGPKPVGALKRWRESYPPPRPEYTKMAMPGTDKKAGWWQFSAWNQPKSILVLTEQPIDALSVMSAAVWAERQMEVAVAGFGGQGGVTEKLVGSAPHLIIATDHDTAGLGYAQQIEHIAQRLPTVQSVTRCLPPEGKDWNDWWRQDRDAAITALARALDTVREAARDPSPFARHSQTTDMDR